MESKSAEIELVGGIRSYEPLLFGYLANYCSSQDRNSGGGGQYLKDFLTELYQILALLMMLMIISVCA